MQSQRESWKRLVELGAYVNPKIYDPKKSTQKFTPQLDPDNERISLFRTIVEDCELNDLTLDAIDFCRSTIRRVKVFRASLINATMRWNDFFDCEFDSTDLTRADMRSSLFMRCSFKHCTLNYADLRHSHFELCTFLGATVIGTKLTYEQGDVLNLDAEQRRRIDWQDDGGPRPEGG